MLKVLVSASPEDFSEAFTKGIKNEGLEVKLKVWSRSDHSKMGYDLYLLTQRDFVYLDKIHQLPPASRLIAIFSPSYKESFLIEETDVRFTGFIMGEVDERAYRSVDLINLYLNHQHLYAENISLEDASLPSWLAKRVDSVLSDLKEFSSGAKFNIHKDENYLTLKFQSCPVKFGADDFKLGFNPQLMSKNAAVSGVILNRIFDNASTFIQISNEATDRNEIIVQFRLLKSQKAYENFPKLFALLPKYEFRGIA